MAVSRIRPAAAPPRASAAAVSPAVVRRRGAAFRKGEQTRAAIVDAALELAARVGLEGLTIGSLAERMAMSKSGVFAHFGSREDLQIAVAIGLHPAVLVGANASAWKNDVLAVNGFDETYTYGSDDKDLGVRMSNNGVKSRRLKYSLVCVHLAHPRTYASPEHVRENKQKLRQVRAERITWTRHGIYAGRRESGAPQEPLVTPPVPDGNPAIPECGVA